VEDIWADEEDIMGKDSRTDNARMCLVLTKGLVPVGWGILVAFSVLRIHKNLHDDA
jgi:hypothetical protein